MTTDIKATNKRIAQNTLTLYVRMLITMVVGLYTSRVVLQTLGVSDYGVFNVVGGIIGMLGYINNLFASGVSRFLTIGLGENNQEKLKLTFSTSVFLTILTALLVLIAGETIGVWFVNNHLNINPDRIVAVNWVYQCALASSVLTVAQAPFTASIISHEKMNVYAYMSIFDAAMKLLIVYLLLIIRNDKLITYSILLFIINTLDIVIYRAYCIKYFEECKPSIKFDKTVLKGMLSFSGYNMLGSLSAVCMNYGINIVINIFFGTIVNAARGVATQVGNIIQQLYSNFQLAGRPQVMKYYAQGDFDNMFRLMYNNGKYCAFLLLCPIIPICFFIDGLLELWLTEVPEYTADFLKLSILYIFFRSLDEPLTVAIHAVGKMKLPNLTSATLNMIILPFAYVIYMLGGSPLWGAALLAMFVPLCTMINFGILYKYINFPWKTYIKNVFSPVVRIAVLASILPTILYFINPNTIWTSLLFPVISGINVCIIVFCFGLSKTMQKKILKSIKQKFLKNNQI